MATVGLYTLGCKVSQYETEAIGEAFADRGHTLRPFDEPNDVYVINTCTVTAESDRKSRQIIRRAIGQNPNAVVVVTGCYSQVSPNAVAAIAGVSAVIGNDKKLSVVDLAESILAQRAANQTPPVRVCVSDIRKADFEPMCVRGMPRTRAYVKIEDGCECRCTYCTIPAARGNVRSKPAEDVVREVEALAANGTREVVLTGIETASYGADLSQPYRLIDLLETLDRRGSCERIRLGSLSPEVMRAPFIERLRALRIPVPHFHLSMQSGSNAVLAAMKRRYNREMALDALAQTRAAIPNVQFTTDMMVGFPGESREHFEETLDFVRRARFLDIHVFAYSRRPGTPAAALPDQVPEQTKRERSAILIAEKNRIRDRILDEIVREGAPLSVIFETRSSHTLTAHADNFIEVAVECDRDLRGQIHNVIPIGHRDGILLARLDRSEKM